MAAKNGMNIEAGIDLSQFEKDLKTLNKELKTVAGQKLVAELTIDGSNIKKSLQHEFKSAQTEWKNAFKEIEKIQFSKKGQLVNVQDIKDAQKAIEQFSKEYHKAFKVGDITAANAAANNIAKLQRYVAAVGKLSDASAKLGIATTPKAKAAMKAERAEIDREIKSLERRKQLLSANPNMSTLDKLREELALTKQIINMRTKRMATYASGRSNVDEKHLTALRAQSAEIQRQIRANSQNNSILGSQGSILSRLRTLATRYLDVFMLSRLGEQIAKTTGYFEKQQVALEGIVGSATKAAEIMGQIKAFAPNSPFQTKDLIRFTKQLAAYNISPDELFTKTKMLADLSAGLGVDMNRIILAYGQVNAAAVLRGQELRQFTEAGIPMVQKLAEKFTELNGRLVTTGEVFELISKRQVPFEMVASVLSDMTSEGGKFYKMQENLMETTYGQIEKLKDLWTLSLNDIGSTARGTINGVIKLLQKMVKNASSLLKGLLPAAVIINIGEAIIKFKLLRKEIGLTAALVKSAWSIAGLAIGGAIALVTKLWDENHKIQKQFDDIHSSFQKQTRNAINGLDGLIKKLKETTEGTKAYKDAFDTLTANYSQYITVTDEYVQKLLTEQETYDALVTAIQKYNEALEKKQQLEQSKTTMGESFEMGDWNTELSEYASRLNKNWPGILKPFTERYGMPYKSANARFAEAMSSMFGEMRNKDMLSISEDRSIRDQENRKAFDQLLPSIMKQEGLENLFKEFSKEAIDDLWEDFNREAFNDNDSQRAYEKYRMLRREQLGEGTSDFAWLSRIESVFKDLSETLPRTLNAADPRKYTLGYNAGWTLKAYKYLNKENGDFRGLTDSEGNQLAKNEFDALMKGMRRELKNFDDASIANVHELMKNYHDALAEVDNEAAGMFTHFMKMFIDGTEEASGKVAAVRNTMFKTWEAGSKELKFALQYLPTNNTFETTREKLPQERQARAEALRRYNVEMDKSIPGKHYKYDPTRDALHSEEAKKEIQRLIMEYEVLGKLMEGVQEGVTITVQNADGTPIQPQLFDIMDREKETNIGSGTREIPDFYNVLKNAYDIYKKAIQGGGIAAGVNEVRTNARLQDVYGLLFGGAGGSDLESVIGNKTLGEILVGSNRERLIKGGLEDGIVDFREAGKALADELEAYYHGNEKERVAYLRMAEQVRKWVDETFTKDEVQKWLDSFQRSVQNLTVDFENMHNNIELARKMAANGTIGSYAKMTGLEAVDYTRPQSLVQRDEIARLLTKYNEFAGSVTGANGKTIPVFTLGDISNIKGINDQIQSLNETLEVNNGAFKALPQGEILVKALIAELKNLDKTIRDEIGSINGKQFTGNPMADAIANAMTERGGALTELMRQMRIDTEHAGGIRPIDYKQYADSINKLTEEIFKNFEKVNGGKPINFTKKGDVLGLQPYDIEAMQKKYNEAVKSVESASMKGELDRLWYDLKKKMEDFNASIGTGMLKYMKDFLHPEQEAKRRWDQITKEEGELGLRQMALDAKNKNGLLSAKEGEELLDINARLIVIRAEKAEMGENGVNLIPQIRENAAKNANEGYGDWSEALNKTKAATDAVLGSIKSLINGFAKFYDMVHDGENPTWLKDMEAVAGDLIDNFEALVAPIVAVMGLIIAFNLVITTVGVTAGVVFGALIAAALIVAAVFAAIQQQDRRLEHSIEDLKDDIEALDNAISNLNSEAERSVGLEKLRKEIDAFGKSASKATDYAEMYRLENEKKNSDTDKLKEYEQSRIQAENDFLNGIREIRDELVKSTEDWADSMSNALRSAFQNGENAARAFRDTVKTMIGDIVENMLKMSILEPLIEGAIENFTHSNALRDMYTNEWYTEDENGNKIKHTSFDSEGFSSALRDNIMDPDKAEDFYRQILMIGDTWIDLANGLPDVLKDALFYQSELGTLSGGIEGITEDTARRIEALGNSQLGEVIAIRMLLDNYMSGGDGFGDSTMATIQASIASISSDTNLIRIATESILSRIDQMRTSNVQPLHVTIV